MNPELVYVLSQDSSSPFYSSYAGLFKTYLSGVVSNQTVKDLNIVGHLLFQMMMHIDRIEDDNENNIETVIALQTESIKRLSCYFPIDHPFWTQYDRIAKGYSKHKELDQLCQKHSVWVNYEALALSRSIYAELGLISWLELGLLENQTFNSLCSSHKHFIIAFQLYDDCSDFYEDQTKNQFNWAIFEAQRLGIDVVKFYQSILFKKLTQKIIHHLDEAADRISDLPVSEYSLLLKRVRNSVHSLYGD